MRYGSGRDGLNMRNRAAVIGIGMLLLLSVMVPGVAVAAVYRCPDGSGGVLFQQVPCVQGEEVELDVRTTKWVASPTLQLSNPGRHPARSGSRDQAALARVARAEREQKLACWKAEQRIERIEAELRRGYKPARGNRLRQQRREQSDYLREFCR